VCRTKKKKKRGGGDVRERKRKATGKKKREKAVLATKEQERGRDVHRHSLLPFFFAILFFVCTPSVVDSTISV
jgi:hypothetical protein